ncbi:prolipoprotein diacylglyceryl transferase family protein [Undibacterium sp. TJN25]|uniref:prolipoprotein diacylglyceryl transferase family protein n=1 Tax=Undibacterium sp. TJN25 TaxID=3413056 RepID=UPI003BF2C2EB
MHSISLGFFSISATQLLMLGSLLLAAGVGHIVGKPKKVGVLDLLLGMTLAGLVVARIVFVAIWFPLYLASPLSMLDIRDGGFHMWAGVVTGLAFGAWRCWKRQELVAPLTAGLLAAFVVGDMAGASHISAMSKEADLPAYNLNTLDGKPTTLAKLAHGKPVIVNLWASWCPPCRREMPALAEAQRRHKDMVFIFVNQDTDVAAAKQFISDTHLVIDNVVLDPAGQIPQAVGSSALPTTLFYDGGKHMVDLHIGGFSIASFSDALDKFTETLKKNEHAK